MREERRKHLKEEQERLNNIYRKNVKIYIITLIFMAIMLLLAKRLNPGINIGNPLKVLLALIGGWIIVLALAYLRRK